jgi:hypothetical protein
MLEIKYNLTEKDMFILMFFSILMSIYKIFNKDKEDRVYMEVTLN